MNIRRRLFLGLAGAFLAAGTARAAATRVLFADEAGNPQYFQSISTVSARLMMMLVDDSYTPSTSSTPVTVSFPFAFDSAGNGISGAVRISTNDFASSVLSGAASIAISSGSVYSSAFRVGVSSVTGGVSLYGYSAEFPAGGYAYLGLDVLGNVAFTGLSVRNDPAGVAGSSTTITPDRDGVQDAAVIRGSLPGVPSWQILIYPAGGTPASPIQTLYGGSGVPEVFWYGYDSEGRTVPNGVYNVRFQTFSGSIINDSLTVTVNSAYIKGALQDSSSLGGVQGQVNVYGLGGGGSYATVPSASSSTFEVWGLKAGQQYGVQVKADGYVDYSQNNVSGNTDLSILSLQRGARLNICVSRSTGAAGTNPDLWGSLSANTTDYAAGSHGSVHFVAESTAADNGAWNPVDRTTFTILSVLPSRTINLRLTLPQYGSFTRQFTSPAAGGVTSIIFSSTEIVKQPTVSGVVTLPVAAPAPYGTFVSVAGYKGGGQQPSVFGGGFAAVGQTTAAYQVFGVSTGSWVFRTHSQGLRSSSSTLSFGTLTDQTINFTLSQGGVISGTVTLQGDSSTAPEPQNFGGISCSAGQIPVAVNAWSPATFSGAWSQVCITTGTSTATATYQLTGLDDAPYEVYSFLPGFQLDPPGRMTAAVSGGTANLDINYKRLSGALQLSVLLPAGDLPSLVGYQLESTFGGPDSTSESGAFPGVTTVTIGGLGTGVYQVVVQNVNAGRGLIKRTGVAVVNGSTSTLSVDMRDATFTASGTVSLSGSIGLPSPWAVTVSSVAGLAQAAAVQGATAPVVQVFAYPLPENFHGDVQPYQTVRAVPVAGQSNATFTVTGLPAGSYLFRVQNDLNPPTCQNCSQAPGLPEFGTSSQVVLATADVSGISLALSNGFEVSGDLSTAVSDSETRAFQVNLRREDGLVTFQSTVTVVSGAGSFAFQHISDGNYTLDVREMTVSSGSVPKFVCTPVRVTVAGGAVEKDVELLEAGSFVGLLRDADTNTLVTSFNQSQFLPDNFFFYARANPWTPGGFAEMERCNGQSGCTGNVYISSATGQFAIYRVMPGEVYDVLFSGFRDSGSGASKGQKTYAPVSISGQRVEAGQTVDLGIVDLRQGVTLSGKVTLVGSTTPLANVPVAAYPSQLDGGERSEMSVQAFTDQSGEYILRGIDPGRRFYDVIAAPRPRSGDVRNFLSGPRYGQETDRNVNVTTASSRQNVDFSLTPANGGLTGLVVTEDGGALQKPAMGDRSSAGDNRAVVTLHLVGSVNNADNPLGEIESETDVQGNFNVSGLKPGTYLLRAIAMGYVTAMKTVAVAAGANSAGTLTLKKGASLSGSIRKPDGSAPSTSEVKMVVGVDQDFQEFVFASLISDDSADQVTGYELEGFKTGLPYSIVMASEGDDIIEAASGITFTSSTETRTLDLVFKPSPPAVFVTQSRSGDTYTVRFFSTHKLRNVTADDNDLTQIVSCLTCGAGTGALNTSSSSINGGRDTVEVVYDAVPNETSFQLEFAFTSAKVDAETGSNFTYSGTFDFYAGVDKVRIVRIGNTLGGACSLEGSEAGGEFPPGTFDVASSSSVDVGVQTTTSTTISLSSFGAPPVVQARARALGMGEAARRLGRSAYPTAGLYKAMVAAPSVSQQVFSNFYDIFLPAGVSHSLKKDALITLKYSDAITDPSSLNVYYFDPGNDVYLLESNKRLVDTVNKTITVAVRHLSTFVVLSGNAPVVGTDAYTGAGVQVTNFPNPFNLKPKTVTLAKNSSVVTQDIQGTQIRCALPPGKSGAIKIEIYDAAGTLVRTITQTGAAAGSYNYFEWDGRNDGGKQVASGVYLGRFTLNGGDEKVFKMAVLK